MPLKTSYPETAASRDFARRNGMHCDTEGRLLDPTRRIDSSAQIDTNRLVDPAHATDALNYQTPDPGFTPTEQLKFALAYKDTPAKFGLISQYLPGRTCEDCINHYYFHKRDGRFKNESRKMRYDRLPAPTVNGVVVSPPRKELDMAGLPDWDIRLRGQANSHALAYNDMEEQYHNNGRLKRKGVKARSYGPSEDDLRELVPIDMHIAELKQELGISGARVFEKPSGRRNRVVVPPPAHIEVLSNNFRHPFHMANNELMHWLRSDKVLPLVKEWFDAVVHNEDLHSKLLSLLEETGYPYEDQIGDIARIAHKYKLWTPTDLGIAHQEVLVKCAQFAYRLGIANQEYFSNISKRYSYPEEHMYLDGSLILLFALEDSVENPVDGFFAILLDSELAGMVRPEFRGQWERVYPFEDEVMEHMSDQDERQNETVLLTREERQWDAIVAYEGVNGKRKDFDEVEVAKQVKVPRFDSGLGEA